MMNDRWLRRRREMDRNQKDDEMKEEGQGGGGGGGGLVVRGGIGNKEQGIRYHIYLYLQSAEERFKAAVHTGVTLV